MPPGLRARCARPLPSRSRRPRWTVREWIGRGELEAYKIGKEWRVRRDHLDDAIEARRVGAQAAPTGGLWDPADRDER
jgi:excisionase family DNA binding protein